MAATAILSVLFGVFLYFYHLLLVKPNGLRSKIQRQGIKGPSSPSFLFGNIPEIKRIQLNAQLNASKNTPRQQENRAAFIAHDWPSALFPHLEQWRTQHGEMFLYSAGTIQFLCITDIEIVKEISMCTTLSLGKPSYLSKDRGPILGQGILSTSGPIWAHQRKIIAPEFYFDKVKGMVNLMVDSTASMVRSWESTIENEGGQSHIKVDDDLRALSADIISRACFGSNYSQGKEIFLKIRALQKVMSKESIGVPGFRYISTKNNREMWKLEKEIEFEILKVVKERTDSSCEKDLLHMIHEGAKSVGEDDEDILSGISKDRFVVDNCKNIYFAGHETTAITASWCLMLLALHPHWQVSARAEVLQVYDHKLLDADMLRSMKTLTMVIQETLRLYPPAAFVIREATEDIVLKGVQIPKGMNIQIPIPMLQQNLHLWGRDALMFNPERFTNGVLGACKTQQAYMPFGVGARVCVGQHFAMTELKVILSIVLSKFEFSLSPAYHHSPAFRLVIEPQNGVILHVKKL